VLSACLILRNPLKRGIKGTNVPKTDMYAGMDQRIPVKERQESFKCSHEEAFYFSFQAGIRPAACHKEKPAEHPSKMFSRSRGVLRNELSYFIRFF